MSFESYLIVLAIEDYNDQSHGGDSLHTERRITYEKGRNWLKSALGVNIASWEAVQTQLAKSPAVK